MSYKYPNLTAEVARHNMKYSDIYADVSSKFHRSNDAVSNWFTGRAGELPTSAAFYIRDTYFPDKAIDYLFNPEPL